MAKRLSSVTKLLSGITVELLSIKIHLKTHTHKTRKVQTYPVI